MSLSRPIVPYPSGLNRLVRVSCLSSRVAGFLLKNPWGHRHMGLVPMRWVRPEEFSSGPYSTFIQRMEPKRTSIEPCLLSRKINSPPLHQHLEPD